MTTVEPRQRSPDSPAPDRQGHLASAVERVTRALDIARSSATTMIGHLPGTMRATRARAHNTTSALQTLPDSTLRWLVASSVGLGAGLRLAGAPRVAIAAGVAPAVVIGAAIVLRPITPVSPAHEHANGSTGGMADMTDEHAKGAMNKAKGKIEEGLGKLTGDRRQQAKGTARQVQGEAQDLLGDIRDAARPKKKKP